MKKPLLFSAILVAVLLLLDQWIKLTIKTQFSPGEFKPLLGNWLVLHYTENPGMAFGQTFGASMWAKLSLSLFRIVAIGLIIRYLFIQIKLGTSREFLIVVSLVLAGATGNLLDSMFYDLFFSIDPCIPFNQLAGSGHKAICHAGHFNYAVELRHQGFLFGNVVDMFQFNVRWPAGMPLVGGSDVFPAIWNLADFCISVGLFWAIIRQKKFFPKEEVAASEE
ncbi:MAG: signal peptidase II [Crocinitomicaceae bacterium]|nr:signal peptidase II [Crocinitomicaceae bacterium]MDP4806469.1 signal peptidase II [Crocinitomicaceae bacterium]MDP5042383.1 signal peptidase II [Crocinitomicaceae bacterium]MDP5066139.1 signal peptidase II [Crocinitomicaceae bacterium]